jgi:hypothetical protein
MNADLAKHIYASQKVSKGLAHVKNKLVKTKLNCGNVEPHWLNYE